MVSLILVFVFMAPYDPRRDLHVLSSSSAIMVLFRSLICTAVVLAGEDSEGYMKLGNYGVQDSTQ